MPSKISGFDTRSAPVGAGRAVERARGVATDAKSSDASGSIGDIHITGTARQLADLEQMVKNMPAVDDARVAAISSALEQGRYQISSDHIASQLLNLEQVLAPLGGK